MNLREKIEFLMSRAEINRAELSRATQIPYTTLDSILKRDHFENVKLQILRKLCAYFDVSLEYLIFDEITDPKYKRQVTSSRQHPALAPDEHQLISDYRAFNAEGQEKIRDYVADLKDNLKYKKCAELLMDREA